MEKIILTATGPLSDYSSRAILPFETLLFDRSSLGGCMDRLALSNRFMFLADPTKFIDNLSSTFELFEYELKYLPAGTIVCMYKNHLLARSVSQFKQILGRQSHVSVVLMVNEDSCVFGGLEDFLISHVHYGDKNGLFYGMLGPLVISEDVPVSTLEAYKNAQEKTGAPILVHVHNVEVFSRIDFSYFSGHLSFWGEDVAESVAHLSNVSVGDTVVSKRICGLITSGCMYKADFKLFGGSGLSSGTRGAELFAFAWNPPKLDSIVEEGGKWICDICGVSAKLADQENYTKHGFTYCSTSCLSVHRRRNWQ